MRWGINAVLLVLVMVYVKLRKNMNLTQQLYHTN